MKNFFLLFSFIAFTIFTSCNNQEMVDDLVPSNQESTDLSKNHKTDNTINNGKANFTINNEDNTVFEKDVLLLTNNSINAVSYNWDFGNGDTSTKAIPNYKYEIHGNYTVTLTITDSYSKTHQVSHEVLVLCVFGGGNHDQ